MIRSARNSFALTRNARAVHAARAVRGFTLVELVVVIGIIALLIGILLPAIRGVVARANWQATSATLSSIESALEAYEADYGTIPRFSPDPRSGPNNPLHAAEDRGARLLARALFGIAPKSDSAAAPRFMDGHGELSNPFGWKERRSDVNNTPNDSSDDLISGDLQEPYLSADSFPIRKLQPGNSLRAAGYLYGPDAVMLDGNDAPILYYPRLPGNIIVSNNTNSPAPFIGTNDAGVSAPKSAYNANDNVDLNGDGRLGGQDGPPFTVEAFRFLMGDVNNDGVLNAGETASTDAPYVLIATGTAGTYTDEPVTNFPTLGK